MCQNFKTNFSDFLSTIKDNGGQIYDSYKIEKYPVGHFEGIDECLYLESIVRDVSMDMDDDNVSDIFPNISFSIYNQNSSLIAKAEFIPMDAYHYGSLENLSQRADDISERLCACIKAIDEWELKTLLKEDNPADSLTLLVLDHIAVDTKYQRKGLGTYMLNRAIDIFFEMSEFDFITDNTIIISSLIDTQSMIDIDGGGKMVEATEPKALKAMVDKYFNSLICSEQPLTPSNKETAAKHQYYKPLKMKNSDYFGWVV